MADTTLSTRAAPHGAEDFRTPILYVAHHAREELVGRSFPLASGTLEVGRESDALGGLWLGDAWLSRRHATLFVSDSRVALRDHESRNGTFVNARPIREHRMVDGDVLRVGDLILVYRLAAHTTYPTDPLLVGCGPAMAQLLRQLDAVAPRATPVLLTGPPGVGKGVVARSLHERSGRPGKLVPFDCGAVGDGVVHSELFGHTSGAFSGAERARAGLVDEARGGTLLLDEVGDASPALQSALLRLLEEGEVRAVGSNRVTRPDVRVVAATNRDLKAAAEQGRFRLDLWTRLSRWVIPVPPLTARREDIGLLLRHRAAAHAGRPVKLAASLVETLTLHTFPGNVRELDALVERAVVETAPGEPLRLPAGWVPVAPAAAPAAPEATGRGERPPTDALVEALRQHGGNVTHVARALGAARHSVYRWCRELEVEPADYRPVEAKD